MNKTGECQKKSNSHLRLYSIIKKTTKIKNTTKKNRVSKL